MKTRLKGNFSDFEWKNYRGAFNLVLTQSLFRIVEHY